MREHALQQTRILLRRLAYEINRNSKLPDVEAVHDLRVAIRRFRRCLRVFRNFLPAGPARRIRRQLKGLMRLAAEVRDRDMTMKLLARARVPVNPELLKERKRAEKALAAAASRAARRNFSRKWRVHLSL